MWENGYLAKRFIPQNPFHTQFYAEVLLPVVPMNVHAISNLCAENKQINRSTIHFGVFAKLQGYGMDLEK